MAVQQNKKSPSRRGMRRLRQRLAAPAVSVDKVGDKHLRHHIAPSGHYRGREVIVKKPVEEEQAEE